MKRSALAVRLLAILVSFAMLRSATGSLEATAQVDPRYVAGSGFRIDDDAIWDFFVNHGSTRAFGAPISRTFRLHGLTSQLFERHLLQIRDDGSVRVTSLLDTHWLPYTRWGGYALPAWDPAVVGQGPPPDDPEYVDHMMAFVSSALPDEFSGFPTNFLRTFSETIAPLDPSVVDPDAKAIQVLQNLDIWGIPTSRPLRDPAHPNLISVRLERGILRFDSTCRCTEPLALGNYFRAVLTGSDLPSDVEAQAPDSPYLRQYDLDSHTGPYRAWALPDTDLNLAFLPSSAMPPYPVAVPTETPGLAPTSTPVIRPTSTITPTPTLTLSGPGGAPLPPQSASPPPPPSGPGIVSRQPYEIILQGKETGRETTLMASKSGWDDRASWQWARYERDRTPEMNGVGPNVLYNKIYVARTFELARQIYNEEIAVRNFPESVDRYGATFFLDRPSLGEDVQALASCFEEGCNATRYSIHIRLVFRTLNVVSVFYTFGDQTSSSLSDVTFIARHVADRMVP